MQLRRAVMHSGRLLIQVVVIGAVAYFLGRSLWQDWDTLRDLAWQIQPAWLLVAYLPLAIGWFSEASLWRWLLSRFGGQIRFRSLMVVWFVSSLLRYLPGGVWQFLGLAHLSARAGVPVGWALTSFAMHQVLSGLSVLLLSTLYYAWASWADLPAPGAEFMLNGLLPGLIVLPVLLLLTQPKWLEFVLNLGLRILRREPMELQLRGRQVVLYVFSLMGIWTLMGLGFALSMRALVPLSLDQIPHLVVAFPLGLAAGYMAVITPGGLGVREGVTYALLLWVLGGALAVVAALMARLWLTVGEVLAALCAVLWQRMRREPVSLPLTQVAVKSHPLSDLQR